MSTTAMMLARPPLARLTSVELRKMTDTRAGFWLQLAVGALTIAVVVLLMIFGDPGPHAAQVAGGRGGSRQRAAPDHRDPARQLRVVATNRC